MNPSRFEGDTLPVEQVSWVDAMYFCQELTKRLPKGVIATLPTEAQWEFACRAGTKTAYWYGDSADSRMMNYDRKRLPTSVKSYAANPWGLYDMHGNVWEYVLDYFSGNTSTVLYYSDGSPVIAPVGASAADARASGYAGYRTKRGGAYDQEARHCTSHRRNNVGPAGVASYNGHRVIFNLPYTIQ